MRVVATVNSEGTLTLQAELPGVRAYLTHFEHWSSWSVDHQGQRVAFGTHTAGRPDCEDARQIALDWITRVLLSFGYLIPQDFLLGQAS